MASKSSSEQNPSVDSYDYDETISDRIINGFLNNSSWLASMAVHALILIGLSFIVLQQIVDDQPAVVLNSEPEVEEIEEIRDLPDISLDKQQIKDPPPVGGSDIPDPKIGLNDPGSLPPESTIDPEANVHVPKTLAFNSGISTHKENEIGGKGVRSKGAYSY